MPGKSSDWDNAEFLMDLTVALYTGAQVNKGLTPAIKESIEEYLKTRGYSTSFDAVRQHVQKLRKNRDASCIQDAGSEPVTARKRAAAPKTPAKRAPKKKAAKSAPVVDDDDELADEKMQLKMELDASDEQIPSPSPAKRARTTPKAESEDPELGFGDV